MITGRLSILPILLLTLLGLQSLSGTSMAQKMIYQHQYSDHGDTQISLTSPFGAAATYGFQTIHVVIKNDTEQNRRWKLLFNNSNILKTSSTFTLAVKAGQEIRQDLLVPVPWSLNHSNYRQEKVEILSPGLAKQNNYSSEQFHGKWPNIIISKKLSLHSLAPLTAYLDTRLNNGRSKSSSSSSKPSVPFASTCDNTMLPADWQSYIGYDALMIAADEWTQLRPAVQKAILEWNRFGGILQIYIAPNDQQLDYRSLGFDRKPTLNNVIRVQRSYGTLELHGWKGGQVVLAQTHNTLSKAAQRRPDFQKGYISKWGLQKAFGVKKFNPLLVIIILTIFSIVVGPINLFVFAKQGRRQRLFITTPLISLITSLIIITIIFFEDGIGGSGRRLLIMNLESAASEKRAYLIQEQISRAGVLLGNKFPLQDSSFIAPVQLAESAWSRTISYSNAPEYSYFGREHQGDWFRSRTEQAQLLQSVQATRSRIELITAATPGQAPRLFSSLEFTIDQFFYIGEGGRIWKAKSSPIAPGSKIEMVESSKNELNQWWLPLTEQLSSNKQWKQTDLSFRRKTRSLLNLPGHFFCSSKDPKVGFIDTLPAIVWEDSDALIFGSVSQSASGNPSPEKKSSAK
ncbi:MAG: hypothetical protein L3J39_10710 [Verrucomicrobiales bacterium]|nr:hypothetical protein [Verrucomicrobiales bacterium]